MPSLPQIDRTRKKNLKILSAKLGIRFRKIEYLEWALQHRSYVNESKNHRLKNNEQLEFIGDSVLGHVIAEYLFRKFPAFPEGKLSLAKSSLVNKETLAALAKSYDLGDFILLGKGEEKGGGRRRASILADAFEAVIAAYYMDRGFKPVYRFLTKIFHDLIKDVVGGDTALDNAKNRLQKVSQGKFGSLPEYRLTAESGPQHKKIFRVKVFVNHEECGSGSGKTKKKAEEDAAAQALLRLENKKS